MSALSLTVNGQGTYIVDPSRPLDGGVFNSQLTGLLTALTNDANRTVVGTAPATASSAGTAGQIVITADYLYVCAATNTWVRAALTTF